MKVLQYPEHFVQQSIQIEGTIEEFNHYCEKFEVDCLATKRAGQYELRLLLVQGERVSFFIKGIEDDHQE